MPKISIIIPVHNTQLYLEECLNSVVDQTYRDIEIVCIDDFSEDNSLEILKEYAENDSRISILELKQHSGPGYARNLGISYASGDYILFLDSDDYLETDLLKTIVDSTKLSVTDVLIFNGEAFDDETFCQIKPQYHYLEDFFFKDRKIVDEYKMHITDFHSPCMKIYKTSFLKKKNILFPVGIVGEDVEFWMKCMINLNHINYIDFTGYHRRYRKGSIMTSNQIRNLRDRVSNFDNLLSICSNDILINNYIVGVYIPSVLQKVFATQDRELILYTQEVYNLLTHKYE